MEIIKNDLRKFADADKALVLRGFFKTGVGEYGEGDVFLGVSVPNARKVAKAHGARISLDDVGRLLGSEIHEERLAGVLILVEKFEKANCTRMALPVDSSESHTDDADTIYEFYLKNASRINNWDLVDLSAPKIVGEYLLGRDKDILYELAKSEDLWERRISIVSTYAFIRAGEFEDCLGISKILLKDSHDLIRKAVGWMLREVGKRDGDLLREFLRENYSDLSRVTLRYAIERFGEDERKGWLKGH
ncbi:MAG: DNA alkylation repair protein [Nanoarchaeota archaeon]|nr:DNA alkylation repair protein [Nanoarchaeota archaeon]